MGDHNGGFEGGLEGLRVKRVELRLGLGLRLGLLRLWSRSGFIGLTHLMAMVGWCAQVMTMSRGVNALVIKFQDRHTSTGSA